MKHRMRIALLFLLMYASLALLPASIDRFIGSSCVDEPLRIDENDVCKSLGLLSIECS